MYGNHIVEVIQIRDHTQPVPEDVYAHRDDLFSVYAITDDTGVVTQRYLYGDYGTRITTDPAGTAGFEPALEVDHGFTGRLHDETSGLIEYRHRWMRPEMGRFVQRDPATMTRPGMRIGASIHKARQYAGGPNLYRYARSNPIRYLDWNGMAAHAVSMAVTEDDLNGNQAGNPPYITNAAASNCSIEFRCNAVKVGQKHCYLVITNPDGSLTEVRAGPQNEGPLPGSDSSMSQGPVGDPCGCGGGGTGGWGVVVPYIGPHGPNARPDGTSSPDGDLQKKPITDRAPVSVPAGMNGCELGNCLMREMNAIGNSCQDYVLGIGWSRNSNTAISTILTRCGAVDPKPDNVRAPGWGEAWYR